MQNHTLRCFSNNKNFNKTTKLQYDVMYHIFWVLMPKKCRSSLISLSKLLMENPIKIGATRSFQQNKFKACQELDKPCRGMNFAFFWLVIEDPH